MMRLNYYDSQAIPAEVELLTPGTKQLHVMEAVPQHRPCFKIISPTFLIGLKTDAYYSEKPITDTVCERTLVTYTLLPSGVTATPQGPSPTEMVSTTVLPNV